MQRFFFPGPPYFLMSLQFVHILQSMALQPEHLPQLVCFFPIINENRLIIYHCLCAQLCCFLHIRLMCERKLNKPALKPAGFTSSFLVTTFSCRI